MANIKQSKPDSGLGIQVKALNTCQAVPSSLGSSGQSGRVLRVEDKLSEVRLSQSLQRCLIPTTSGANQGERGKDDLMTHRIFSSSALLLSSLELSDTQVYAPQIRALLGTAPHF